LKWRNKVPQFSTRVLAITEAGIRRRRGSRTGRVPGSTWSEDFRPKQRSGCSALASGLSGAQWCIFLVCSCCSWSGDSDFEMGTKKLRSRGERRSKLMVFGAIRYQKHQNVRLSFKVCAISALARYLRTLSARPRNFPLSKSFFFKRGGGVRLQFAKRDGVFY
jgi:hypothetical protein